MTTIKTFLTNSQDGYDLSIFLNFWLISAQIFLYKKGFYRKERVYTKAGTFEKQNAVINWAMINERGGWRPLSRLACEIVNNVSQGDCIFIRKMSGSFNNLTL